MSTARCIREFTTYKEELFPNYANEALGDFCASHRIEGFEVFMDDVVPRTSALWQDEAGKAALTAKLANMHVKRIHCSYWAYPTAFLTGNAFGELVERFGGEAEVIAYYGDLTGHHMFERWAAEYALASQLGAQAYTFHVIDYAPIDGKWAFTVSREDIAQAMIYMTQRFLCVLMEKGLLSESSPQIELENAGWGLEYGTQTVEDYKKLFSQLYDPCDKVRIGWDLNHLLHAAGLDAALGKRRFFLEASELTEGMRETERLFGEKDSFAAEWVASQILDRDLIKKIGSLHVSDCAEKEINYFTNGMFCAPYWEELTALNDPEKEEEYGVAIVLDKYDSHLVLGEGALKGQRVQEWISEISEKNPDLVLLHELKNSRNIKCDLGRQLEALWQCDQKCSDASL